MLSNLSTRARIGSISEVAIASFVLEGTGSVDLLIRGIGPGLAGFNVADPLADPEFEVFRIGGQSGSAFVLANVNWQDGGAGPGVSEAALNVGAFSLTDGSSDAAALVSFGPGGFSEVLRASQGGGGIGLVELYSIEARQGASVVPILRNISTRAAVEAGNGVLIARFVLAGTGSRRFLIRSVATGLENFGVSGVVADPMLEVYADGANSPLTSNDNWDEGTGAAEVASAADSVGAFALQPGRGDSAGK